MSHLLVEGSIYRASKILCLPREQKDHKFSGKRNARFLDSTILSVLTLIKNFVTDFTSAAAPRTATAAIRALLRPMPNSYCNLLSKWVSCKYLVLVFTWEALLLLCFERHCFSLTCLIISMFGGYPRSGWRDLGGSILLSALTFMNSYSQRIYISHVGDLLLEIVEEIVEEIVLLRNRWFLSGPFFQN